MGEERARILGMLAEGKISVDEADTLLDALASRGEGKPAAAGGGQPVKGDPGPLLEALPKFLYVKVVAENGDNVDVKVPLALVRSGLKLTSLIPAQAMDQINDSMAEKGISIDFSNMKPEDIDEFVQALREMEVNVDSANGDKVRVYCE
jgi:hypothetical protein